MVLPTIPPPLRVTLGFIYVATMSAPLRGPLCDYEHK
jgi:hypothetical protein